MTSAFQRALERRKSEQEKKDNQGSYNPDDFEKLQWCPIEDQVERIGRIVGAPFEGREKATDVKCILQSKILRDDGKGYIYINWPTKEGKDGELILDESFILYKLYQAINDHDWHNVTKEEKEADPNAKNYRVYKHANSQAFKRIDQNRATFPSGKIDKYPPRFFPGRRVLANWIDRGYSVLTDPKTLTYTAHADNWCKENKHSKILTSKFNKVEASEGKEEREYVDHGIPIAIYNKVLNDIVALSVGQPWNKSGGPTWEGIDICIRREIDKANPAQSTAAVSDMTETKRVSEAGRSLGIIGPLTEEEQAYELYDFDKLYKFTSARKLIKNVKGLFEQVDSHLKSSYLEMLEHLANKETEEAKARGEEPSANGKTVHPVSQPEPQAVSTPATPVPAPVETKAEVKKVEEPKTQPTRTRKEAPIVDDMKKELLAKAFPKFTEIPIEDQNDIVKAMESIEGTTIKYKEGIEKPIPCTCEKQLLWPNTVWNCANCGVKFEG